MLPSSAYSTLPPKPQAMVVEQTMLAFYHFVAGVHEHKTAGTIGVFCHARIKAGLSE
jgi:hypothetical protein